MGKNDDIMGFMKGKAKIIGDIEHSVPPEDWNSTFDQLDDAGLPDDVMEDRDKEPPQAREDWEPEYDDEPRTSDKSALDLFRESCEAADRERCKRKSEDQ